MAGKQENYMKSSFWTLENKQRREVIPEENKTNEVNSMTLQFTV